MSSDQGEVGEPETREPRADAELDALLVAVVVVSSDAIICCDEAQLIVEFNRGASQMFLRQRQDVLGQPLGILIPPRFRDAHASYVGRYAASGEPRRMASDRPVVRGIRSNGEEFDAEATIASHEVGGRRWFSVIVRDRDADARAKAGNERGWRELFDACPEGIFIADHDGRYLDVNPAGCRMTGYRRDELLGKTVTDLLAADPGERLAETRRQLDVGQIQSGEWLLRRKDGTYLPVDLSAELLSNGRWLAFTRDIHERKAMEAARHLDQQRLRVALTGSPISAFTQDRELRYTWSFNPPLPFTPAEIVGKAHAEVTHGALGEQLRAIKLRVIETGTPARELICNVVDGIERYFDMRFEPLRDDQGRIVGITGAAWDVTDRKRAEDSQRFVAELGAALSAVALDGTQVLARVAPLVLGMLADLCIAELVDEDGHVQQRDVADLDPERARACEVLRRLELDSGRPLVGAEVLRTRTALLIEEVSPQHLAALAQSDAQLERLREAGLRSLIVVPLVSGGRLLGAYLLGARARRYGSYELELALALAQRVAVAVDNARLYEAVQRASNARAEVLAIVAHDLRSPLNAIVLQTRILPSIIKDNSTINRAIDRIHRSAQRMDRLIHDLLDVVRLESGEPLGIELANVSPILIAEHAVDALRPQAEAAHIKLELDLEASASLPDIRADPHRLAQVLDNLVGNAIKFSHEGVRVVVSVRRHGDDVLFSVVDFGPGLRPDQIDRLFDRFWQADRHDRRGSGLGLTLTKAIIEAHHGKIWVDSRVGSGTTVFFTVPAL